MRVIPSLFAFPSSIHHVLVRSLQRAVNPDVDAPMLMAHGVEKPAMKRFELMDLRWVDVKVHQGVNHCRSPLRIFRVRCALVRAMDTSWRSSNRGTNSPGAAWRSRPFHRASTGLNWLRRVESSRI